MSKAQAGFVWVWVVVCGLLALGSITDAFWVAALLFGLAAAVALPIDGVRRIRTERGLSSKATFWTSAIAFLLGGMALGANADKQAKARGTNNSEQAAPETIAKKEEPQPVEAEVTPPPPARPQPLYASIDGDDYLYSAGISKDAEEAGQVAGEFMPFRYRGVKDGKIVLLSKALRCDQVCTVITVIDQFGNKQHLEYNPDSVAGAAFTDAMNGLLVEHPSRQGK